jgi:hypothetical protein
MTPEAAGGVAVVADTAAVGTPDGLEPRDLVLVGRAERMLAEARTFDEIRLVIDLAEQARLWARQARLGLDAQNHAGAIRLEAEAKAAKVLADMAARGDRHPQGRTSEVAAGDFTGSTLAELGVTRTEASRWAAVARVDPKVRATYVAAATVDREEVTRAGLLAYATARPTPGAAEAALPALPAAAPIQRGELFGLGRHRLLCGDSTDPADVARLMDGERVACVWTDPPWGVGHVGMTAEHLRIVHDDPAGSDAVLRGALANAPLVASAPFYLTAPSGPRLLDFLLALREAGWVHRETLVWDKTRIIPGHLEYQSASELILFGSAPGPGRPGRGNHDGSRWYGGNAQSSILRYPKPAASRDHPTAKPIALVMTCVRNSTQEGDFVYDAFSGAGSTILAAERLGRVCYAVEIDPRCVAVTIARWERETSVQAVRL